MIELTDINCRIGNGPEAPEGSVSALNSLDGLMSRFNVKKALVHHAVARYAHIKEGNSMLVDEAKKNSKFIPQFCVLPQLFELFYEPDELVDEMKKCGAKAVRMFPKQYGHSVKRYAAGELFDMLAQKNIPVFMDLEQLGSWDDVYELCVSYPDNRFVICRPGYRSFRFLVPVLDACSNLSVETSDLLIHNGLRELCSRGYTQRLYFGSGVPDASLAAAASQLLLSDITEDEKRLIGSLNAEKLFAEVKI